jgi:hypothetical protein
MAANVIEMAPRAPIVLNTKSGTMDFPDGYQASVRRWIGAAREEAIETAKLNPEFAYIQTYIDMLEGRYWPRSRPSYRSKYFDNAMFAARIDALCALTDIRPAPEISSSDNHPHYLRQAEIAKKIIAYEWAQQDLDLRLEEAVDHALLSVGYWKIGASMPGRMHVLAAGMDSVFPIQPGRDIQDSSGVLYRVYKPLHRIKQVYGAAADNLERQISIGSGTVAGSNYSPPDQVPEYGFTAMSPTIRSGQQGRYFGVSPQRASQFPVALVEEFWIDDPSINESGVEVLVKDPRLQTDQHNYWYRVPPGGRLFPRKRLIVVVGEQVLYDGPSCFWHGRFPFAQLILVPAVWRNGGVSIYRNLVPLAIAKNELGAGMMDLSRRAVEPQFAFVDGAVDDTSFRSFHQDMPGARLKFNPTADPVRHATYLQPPPLPSYVGAFWDRVDQAFQRHAGTLDIAGMSRKNQIPGGDTIEQFRDTSQTAFRLQSRHIEPFVREAAEQFVSNIFQYYTRAQRMRMLGADGLTFHDFDYDPGSMVPWSSPKEDHWRNFKVQVAAGSMHGGKRDRDKQVAISLYRLNAIPRRKLLEILEFPDIDQILEELAMERQMLAPDAIGKGEVPRLTRGQRTGNPY